jgi:hypothetical protein
LELAEGNVHSYNTMLCIFRVVISQLSRSLIYLAMPKFRDLSLPFFVFGLPADLVRSKLDIQAQARRMLRHMLRLMAPENGR